MVQPDVDVRRRKDSWNRLRRDIKAELTEDLLQHFHGTVSLPLD